MDYQKTLAEVRNFYTERLGENIAGQLIELARPAFALTAAEPGEATGQCRFGGRPLLEPGTDWPMCEDLPLSLVAVLDTDALAPWLGDLAPPSTGLLNFFYLDSDSKLSDPQAMDLDLKLPTHDPRKSAVIPAAPSRAVKVTPPARTSVFEPEPWTAEPVIALPDLMSDPAMERIESGFYIDHQIEDWEQLPAGVTSEDVAFGWPKFPTGSSPYFPDGEDPNHYHHLLQFSGNDQWRIEGDGGWMHFSIPTEALREGDFSRAIHTHDWW
jgi:uncharacterized protein YwqG